MILTKLRWSICAVLICIALRAHAQNEHVGSTGGSNKGAQLVEGDFHFVHADGKIEEGKYWSIQEYYMAPGWSKPKQLLTGGGNYASLSVRSGQARPQRANYRLPSSGFGSSGGHSGGLTGSLTGSLPGGAAGGEGMPGMGGTTAGLGLGSSNSNVSMQSLREDALHIYAILLDKDETNSKPNILVGLLDRARTDDARGMDGGMSSMGGGMGMGMGEMMGGGMGYVSPLAPYPFQPGQTIFLTALDAQPNLKLASDAPVMSSSQVKNLEEMVRVDNWIELALAKLRNHRQDAERFKVAEIRLKELLDHEYTLQLAHQKEDIDRLGEKLKLLQAELARRTTAQDRVIAVQLGQLVLEAQGLLGERP